MREGVWEDDGDGDGEKNMPVAGKRNQTTSLLTQAHRAVEMGGGIKVENVLRPKEEKMGVEEEIKRKYFGFWYVYTEADHRYSDFITA